MIFRVMVARLGRRRSFLEGLGKMFSFESFNYGAGIRNSSGVDQKVRNGQENKFSHVPYPPICLGGRRDYTAKRVPCRQSTRRQDRSEYLNQM